MKNTILIIFTSLIFSGMTAQDEEIIAISEDACGCMEDIGLSSKKEEQYEAIKSCISASILSYQLMQSLQNLPKNSNDSISESARILNDPSQKFVEELNIEIIADKNFKEIEAYSLRNCNAMQQIMTSNNETKDISISDKKKALAFYDEGQKYFREEKYGNAIVEFSKAVKKDKSFAFAWDMLGYSYRKQNQFKQAIESYQKSIALDPNGSMPLRNIPVAYEMMEDYDNAIKSYKNLIAVYPEDPEGYYGIGRMYFVKGEYENALDNTMKAYIYYKKQNSPYIHDAENNIALYYNYLKENGQLELFNRIAKKYDIKIQE